MIGDRHADVVVQLGAPSYFAMLLLALLAVTAVLGASRLRGFIGLFLRLAIGLVGTQTGQPRLTFGQPLLADGIDVEWYQQGEALVLLLPTRTDVREVDPVRMDTLVVAAVALERRVATIAGNGRALPPATAATHGSGRSGTRDRARAHLARERSNDLALDPESLFAELARFTSAAEVAAVRARVDAGQFPLEWLDDLVHLGETDPPGIDHVVQAWGGLADPPTAVFSSNARSTMAVFAALRRAGGAGLALVSFGDFPMADSLAPSVTVIDQSPAAVGTFAARRIFRRLDEPAKRMRRRTVLPVALVERASCTVPVGTAVEETRTRLMSSVT